MSGRRRASVTQADITRAIRAAREAGCEVHQVIVNPAEGTVVIVTSADAKPEPNDFDTPVRRSRQIVL